MHHHWRIVIYLCLRIVMAEEERIGVVLTCMPNMNMICTRLAPKRGDDVKEHSMRAEKVGYVLDYHYNPWTPTRGPRRRDGANVKLSVSLATPRTQVIVLIQRSVGHHRSCRMWARNGTWRLQTTRVDKISWIWLHTDLA